MLFQSKVPVAVISELTEISSSSIVLLTKLLDNNCNTSRNPSLIQYAVLADMNFDLEGPGTMIYWKNWNSD